MGEQGGCWRNLSGVFAVAESEQTLSMSSSSTGKKRLSAELDFPMGLKPAFLGIRVLTLDSGTGTKGAIGSLGNWGK